jgi:hypothetical protein
MSKNNFRTGAPFGKKKKKTDQQIFGRRDEVGV